MPPTRHRLPTPEERAAELAETARAVEVALRWVYVRAVMLCLVWLALGLACIAWAVHSTDEQTALIVFWGGLLVANGGILVTLFITYQRAMEEGWL